LGTRLPGQQWRQSVLDPSTNPPNGRLRRSAPIDQLVKGAALNAVQIAERLFP